MYEKKYIDRYLLMLASSLSMVHTLFQVYGFALIEVVKPLLAHGSDINQIIGFDVYNLFIASQQGYVEIFRKLIAHGAKAHHTDDYGNGSLFQSSSLVHVAISPR